ncbi:4'-phosphopantetheinyl transferase family protein [Hathewaya histolytica]|uniref:4'-phosphopantetheinyl transferase family protein n=1 Tax=Hathewaya histolytica TaxID=1498 RepID=UPI003B66DF60
MLVELYVMNVKGLDLNDSRNFSMISEERKEKVENYLHDNDKKLSLGAGLLLNYGLKRRIEGIDLPINFKRNKNGKIQLWNYPSVYVNLSHSQEYAVCAVSSCEIGVDIERCDSRISNCLELAKQYFHPREYEDILHTPLEQQRGRFFEFWVLKECYLKAIGRGLYEPLNSFFIKLDSKITICQQLNKKTYSFQLFPNYMDSYKLAVCAESETLNIRLIEVSAKIVLKELLEGQV